MAARVKPQSFDKEKPKKVDAEKSKKKTRKDAGGDSLENVADVEQYTNADAKKIRKMDKIETKKVGGKSLKTRARKPKVSLGKGGGKKWGTHFTKSRPTK